jgi:LPXTG-motif cell wall-anchored protein
MKKNNTFLVLGITAAAAAAFIFFRNKKAAGENLRFEPVDIAIDSARSRSSLWTRLYYKVKINLINAEPAAVNVRGVVLNATTAGRPLGTLTSTQAFSVPANGAQVVQLETSISTLGAASTIINVLRNREPLTVNINGYVDTDLGRVLINFNKTVTV